MKFLFPHFLFLLFALAIPVFIHLFNFRRYKKVLFTNVRLLRDIEIKTKSVKQLKNYLILACRMLALSFLIFAFAQPFIPGADDLKGSGKRTIAIYIDNSFSMQEGFSSVNLLEIAKTAAHNLVEDVGNSAEYFLLSNGFPVKEMNGFSKEEMLEEIKKIESSYHTRSLSEISNRLKAVKTEKKVENMDAYLFSDFQITQFEDFDVETDSSIQYILVHLQSDILANISIDTCFLSNSKIRVNGIDSLYISLSNYSEDDIINHPVRLYIDDQQVSINSVDLKAWGSGTISVPVTLSSPGFYSCKISIPDKGISHDDELFFSFSVDSATNVYHIGSGEANHYFESVFQNNFNFKLSDERNIDVAFLSGTDALFISGNTVLSSGLSGEIKQLLKDGANLIIYPTDSVDLKNMNDLLSSFNLETFVNFDTSRSDISISNISSPLFSGSIVNMPDNPNLPVSKGFFKLREKSTIVKEDILSFNRNQTALRRYKYENGNIFLFTFPLVPDYSNYLTHSLFVPVTLNTSNFSSKERPLFHIIGRNDLIEYSRTENNSMPVSIKSKNLEIIPEMKSIGRKKFIVLHGQIKESGNYELKSENKLLSVVSMNYDKKESDVRRYSKAELEESILRKENHFSLFSGKGEESIKDMLRINKANTLWKYCIILALLFFLTEALLIKFLKT